MKMRSLAVVVLALAVLIGTAGCGRPLPFPLAPVDSGDVDAHRAYDTNSDGRADWFLLADSDGRVDRIGYDRHRDGRIDRIVELAVSRPARSRHLVIVLDGVSYDLIHDFYAEGGLRMFHPPSYVVTPYPSMTDLCLSHVLNSPHPPALQAKVFDHHKNRLKGGPGEYLSGANEPHFQLFQYTGSGLLRASGYVWPETVFATELAQANEDFHRSDAQEFFAYFGSSAGMATVLGEPGHRAVLELVEQWANYVIWESHGAVNVTILADHGHPYVPSTKWPVDEHLKRRNWRLRDKLSDREREAVQIKLGLATFATFATRDPAGLAEALVGCEGLDIVNYADGDRVIVLDRNGNKAAVAHRDGTFAYEPITGDPLKLSDLLADVPADADGFRDPDALFAATAHHIYPAPLQRLWEGHFALVQNPPDLICSLDNNYYSGAEGFRFVEIASTHGNLDRPNSTTFVMSTIGPLPRTMRSKDIPAAMTELLGAPWPMRH